MKAIIELQKRAMDSSTDIVELVRYAYAIAYKLELQDFAGWCNAELEGYSDNDFLPEYRCVRGIVKCHFGDSIEWPVRFPDISTSYQYSIMNLRYNIAYLMRAFCVQDTEVVRVSFSSKIEESLIKSLVHIDYIDNIAVVYLEIHKSEFEKICSMIRKIILDWTLKCERQRILGDEWIFTDKEKAMAQNITYNINTLQNMANHNTESTINQTAQNMLVTKGDLQSLVSFLSDKGISEPDIQEFKEIIDIEPNITMDGIQNSKIQQWLGKIAIGGSLVAKGVAIDVIVEAIKQFF